MTKFNDIMNKLLIIICLAFLTSKGFSQDFNFGISAGINYCKFRCNDDLINKTESYKVGFQISTFLKCSFNPKTGIMLEPGFVNRGSTRKESEIKDNLNYLSFPFLYYYTFKDKITIQIGPEISILLSSPSKNVFDSKYDICADAGLFYHLSSKLNIGLRYNRGFISVIKDFSVMNESLVMVEDKLTNQGFSIIMAYTIK